MFDVELLADLPAVGDVVFDVRTQRQQIKPESDVLLGFHTLRHVAATLFIAYLGWTPKRLQVVMGHSSITITFDLYGHLFEDKAADREAMKKIEAAIAAA